MLDSAKRYWIDRRLKQSTWCRKGQMPSSPLNRLSVVVLCALSPSSMEDYEAARRFISSEFQNPFFVCYEQASSLSPTEEESATCKITRKSLQWGIPQQEILSRIPSHVDLLIDLSLTDITPLYYVLASTDASFRMGAQDSATLSKTKYLDFTLRLSSASDKMMLYVAEQMLHYLKAMMS